MGSPPAPPTSGRLQEHDASTVDCAVPLCVKFVAADHRVRPFGKVRSLRVGYSRSREPIGDQPPGRGACILAAVSPFVATSSRTDLTQSNPVKTSPGKRAALGKAISVDARLRAKKKAHT